MEEVMCILVLIADDSELIRERLVFMLSELDWIEIVGQARDGVEALNLIKELQPDVVLLDIWMPKVSGVEVLESVRQTDKSTAIIMLTNDASAQHRRRCLEVGANHFLHKSKDFERLPELLHELHNQKNKKRSN